MPTVRTIKILHRMTVIVPLYLLVIFIVLLLDVKIELLHNYYIFHIISVILLGYATAHLIRVLIFLFGRWVVLHSSRNFSPQLELNRYRECKPISYSTGKKRDHIVLLLHGFTTSPMDWDILTECLREEHVDFHAPLLSGFGQINHDSILAIQKEDWLRQIVDIYDLLAEQYQKISVVGHSMGGMLACYLAQLRPVHELIVSAPALFPQKQHGVYVRVVKNRFVAKYVAWQLPMIPKFSRSGRSGTADTMDSEKTYNYFQYLVAPVRLLFAMLQAQMDIRLENMTYQRFTLMYGVYDLTVDNPAIENYLHSKNLSFQRFSFQNSAHNIFVDFDREQVNDLIIAQLKNTFDRNKQNQDTYKFYDSSVSQGVYK